MYKPSDPNRWPNNLTDDEFREQVMSKMNLDVLADIFFCQPLVQQPQQSQDNTPEEVMEHARKTA